MEGYQLSTFDGIELSIAFTQDIGEKLAAIFDAAWPDEDLTFAYWRPGKGRRRYTAIVGEIAHPDDGDRNLHGNASFNSGYVSRVLDECPCGSGIAFLHSHPGVGWQDMSNDDVVAERDRLASLVAGTTGLPLIGLTYAKGNTWSGRAWFRAAPRHYERVWASTVRTVGRQLRTSFHPNLLPVPPSIASQVSTISVWGQDAQNDLARTHVGIVGLGSVGSIVAEALSRTGVQRLTFMDHDMIEDRNLDRTLGAYKEDAKRKGNKADSARRLVERSHTSEPFQVTAIPKSLLTAEGLALALDCDVLISCVDRPWPRHVMNALAYSHLIPVIDGGILARVAEDGHLQHVDWRVHTVGPTRACLYCLGALLRSDAALDRDGKLDDPDYVLGLSPSERERYGRRNVFAFSLSVAAHEVLQLVGLVSGNARIGGVGAQTYHAYPGMMEVDETHVCDIECDVAQLTASASLVT